jgi:hypothetical protein
VTSRSRTVFALLGALLCLLALAGWPRERSGLAAAAPAPAPARGSVQGGALRELQRARREQALIRAEGTARLLRALAEAPILPGGGA